MTPESFTKNPLARTQALASLDTLLASSGVTVSTGQEANPYGLADGASVETHLGPPACQ